MGRAKNLGVAALTTIDIDELVHFRTAMRRRYSDDEILAELARVADLLGRSPTMQEFRAAAGGRIHPQTIVARFGS